VNPGPMMFNLRRDHLFLQASQNCFSLADRHSNGSRREILHTLNRGNLVLSGLPRNHLSNQLQCPFHPNSLRHPATLHALQLQRCMETNGRYLLLVCRETLEDHPVGFRQSAAYKRWKQQLHHFFNPFPLVEHYECVLQCACSE